MADVMKKCLGLFISLISVSVFAGDLQVLFADDDGNPIVDAVIEVVTPSVPIPDDWNNMYVMDQVDKEFMDNVVIMVKGGFLSFPNSDDIQHHVYSFSDNNTFEIPLFSGNNADPVIFDLPGVSVVGCNIHDWMLGYVYVGDTHLMALSNNDGVATINDMDAGEYTFKIWHERARRGDQDSTYTVTVNASGITQLPVTLNLGRDRRIRRAPSSSGSAY
jgi:hypothetical protein